MHWNVNFCPETKLKDVHVVISRARLSGFSTGKMSSIMQHESANTFLKDFNRLWVDPSTFLFAGLLHKNENNDARRWILLKR